MKNYLIALQKDHKDTFIKFKYLEIDDNYTKAIIKEQLLDSKINIKLENAQITKNNIIGTQGSIDRYPILNYNKYENEKSIIILCRTINNKNKGFCISNNKGEIKFVSEKEAVKISKSTGIANGKLVNNSFISAIRGEFPLIEKINLIQEKKLTKNNIKNIQTSTEIKDRIYGLNLIKKYKPDNILQYIGEENWLGLVDAYKNNIELHKDEFQNCVLNSDKAIKEIENIIKDSSIYNDYLAQVLKVKSLNIKLKGN